MGSSTVTAIYLALLLSPALALVALIPYMIYNFKKHSIIYADKSICYYLLWIFFLSAFFMTMLPFPSIEYVSGLRTPTTQLVPFMFVHDYFEDSGVSVSDFTSVIPSLKTGAFLGPLLNIIMMIPFGFFIRLTFDLSLSKTTIAGLLTSLFFEITQLSGIFGIYPRAYRIFDVDDLIANTIGAMAGWLIVAVLNHIYPPCVTLGNKPLKQGGGISLRRRLPAILFNQIISLVITLIVGFQMQYGWRKRIPACILLFLMIDVVMGVILYIRNNSLGFMLTGLQLVNEADKGKPALWQCELYMLLQGATFILPVIMGYLIYYSITMHRMRRVIIIAASVIITVIYVYIIFAYLLNGVTHGTKLYSDKLCRTMLVLSESAKQTKRFMVIDRDVLAYETVDSFCELVMNFLENNEFEHESALRAKHLVDEAMNDWLDEGLGGEVCELRFDKRRWRKTLFVLLYSRRKTALAEKYDDEAFMEAVSGTRISFEIYYNDGAYIVAIDIP